MEYQRTLRIKMLVAYFMVFCLNKFSGGKFFYHEDPK